MSAPPLRGSHMRIWLMRPDATPNLRKNFARRFDASIENSEKNYIVPAA
jgi:hypothetical protein